MNSSLLKAFHVAALVLISSSFLVVNAQTTPALPAGASKLSSILEQPLHFEPSANSAGMLARVGARTLLLQPDGSVLFTGMTRELRGKTVSLRLDGSTANAPLTGSGRLEAKSNYYLGDHREAWRTGVPQFSAVHAAGVYPGIDLLYYGNGRELEHDYQVAAGADPGQIRMRFEGGSTTVDAATGDLIVSEKAQELLRLHQPKAFQQLADGSRLPVSSGYLRARDGSVTFTLGTYDHALPLTIDPVLTYSTWFGGSGIDVINDVATDAAGNLYAIGQTTSTDLTITGQTPGACVGTCGPANVNATSNPYSATFKIFIFEVDPTGKLLFSTYLGGSGADLGIAIQPGADGLYFAGSTGSIDFPHANAYTTATHSTYDPQGPDFTTGATFLGKLSLDGTQLLYSTNVGYASSFGYGYLHEGHDYNKPSGHTVLALGGSGIAYVTGFTGDTAGANGHTNTPFPVARNAIFPEGYDFVAKFDTTKSGDASLLYATPIGQVPTSANGYAEDALLAGIATDSAGNLWVYGTSKSFDFPATTANAFQPACATPTTSSCSNPFLMELQPDGQAVTYATYLGSSATSNGRGSDSALAIRIDSADNIYLAGITGPVNTYGFSDFPYTNMTFGSPGKFIARFLPGATKLLYASPVGPCGSSTCGMAVNETGWVAISDGFEDGSGSVAQRYGDGFNTQATGGSGTFQIIDTNQTTNAALVTSSALPTADANYDNEVHALAFAPTGELFLAGGSNDSGMTTLNAIQAACNSCNVAPYQLADAFVMKGLFRVTRPTISPSNLTFVATAVGAAPPTQYVTFTNNATFPVRYFSSGVDSRQFSSAAGGTCGDSNTFIPVGGSCTFGIVYNANPNYSNSETEIVTDDYDSVPIALTLHGSIGGTPLLAISPATVSFADTPNGSSSVSQNLTVTNSGSGAATFSSIALAGADPTDFSLTNGCGTTLAVSASCTLTATFKPTAVRTFNATVSVASNDPASPTTATLIGNGIAAAPTVSLTPASANFGNVVVGATATQTLTLANSGGAALPISSVALSGANAGAFSQVNTCGASLAAGASCSISVTFAPSSGGSQVAVLSVVDSGGTQTSSLSGTATVGSLSIAPTTQTFAATPVSGNSSVLTSTISNTTGQAIHLSPGSLTDATDFTQSDNCNGLLASGGTCTASFTLTPKSAGALSSTYAIHDLNNPGTPLTVTLSGNGTAAATPTATLTPASLSFTANASSVSATQIVTLSNTGNAVLAISSITLGGTNPGLFTQTTTCGAALATGASCTVAIAFQPSAAGSFTASLIVTDNSGSSGTTTTTQTAALAGTASPALVAQAVLTPASVNFGSVPLGATSPAQVFTLSNPGTAALVINAVGLSGTNAAAFSVTSNTCGVSLAAGASCTVTVSFLTNIPGSDTATLIATDAVGPQTSLISGTISPISPSDFTLTATPAAQSSYRGKNVAYTLQLTSLLASNAFTNAASLSVTGLPSGATASFSPASVVPGVSSPVATVMTIAIPAVVGEVKPEPWSRPAPLGISLAAILFGFLLPRSRKSKVFRLLSVSLLAVLAGSIVGCGTDTGFKVPTSTSNLVVTATSGTTTHSTTVTLTIQ